MDQFYAQISVGLTEQRFSIPVSTKYQGPHLPEKERLRGTRDFGWRFMDALSVHVPKMYLNPTNPNPNEKTRTSMSTP